MKKYLFLISLLCLTASCTRGPIEDGQYHIFDFTMGPEADEKSLVSDMPVFEFKGNRMKVSPDFYFGLFEDSVYRYKYEDCVLELHGKHHNISLQCKPSMGDCYEIFLDSEKLKRFTIIRPRENE